MATVKLTKNELKKQKDSLKRFTRYLPTLILKKQQLQMVIRQIEVEERELREKQEYLKESIRKWIAVFGEAYPISDIMKVSSVDISGGNIAGVDIPVFNELQFSVEEYNLIEAPLWVDAGIDALKEYVTFDARLEILGIQKQRISNELRITTQRVNLFEKVKIPETKENIRVIRIYLGDQQTAGVVRGKIAKNKVVRVS